MQTGLSLIHFLAHSFKHKTIRIQTEQTRNLKGPFQACSSNLVWFAYFKPISRYLLKEKEVLSVILKCCMEIHNYAMSTKQSKHNHGTTPLSYMGLYPRWIYPRVYKECFADFRKEVIVQVSQKLGRGEKWRRMGVKKYLNEQTTQFKHKWFLQM